MTRFEGTETAPGLFAPLIEIELVMEADGEPVRIRALALIDSGADMSIVPAEIASAAGVEFDTLPLGSTSIGAGGEFEVRKALAKLSSDGEVFVDGQLMVTPPGTLPGPLLGRADFFKTFGVEFEWSKEPPRFHVKKKQSQSR